MAMVDELTWCERENEVLREKLQIHLDRWSFDKLRMEESAFEMSREYKRTVAQQAFELEKAHLLHGMQKQKNLLLQYTLESTQDDMELIKPRVSELEAALQLEKIGKQLLVDEVKKIKSVMKESSVKEVQRISLEWNEKIKSQQKEIVKAVEGMKERHRGEKSALNNRIHSLLSEIAKLNEEHRQRERGDCASKKETSTKELRKDDVSAGDKKGTENAEYQALLHQNDNSNWVVPENDNHKLQKEELEQLLVDRMKLLAEKEVWTARELEFQELLVEKENLLSQMEEWKAQDKILHELIIERDQLKRRVQNNESKEFYQLLRERDGLTDRLDKICSRRDEEVKGISRERDFAWAQLEKVEEKHRTEIHDLSAQLVEAKTEVRKLRNDLQRMQIDRNEQMVELMILRIESKQAKDDLKKMKSSIVQEHTGAEGPTKSLRSEQRNTRSRGGPYRDAYIQDMTPLVDNYKPRGHGGLDASLTEGPEVLSSERVPTLEEDNLLSQVEREKNEGSSDGRSSKDIEELHRKNESLSKDNEELRRENDNLKVLYGQLEETFHKGKQKQEKVSRPAGRKDPTSRNLSVELEAALASSSDGPSSENVNKVSRKRKKDSRAAASKSEVQGKSAVKKGSKEKELESTFPTLRRLRRSTEKKITSNSKDLTSDSSIKVLKMEYSERNEQRSTRMRKGNDEAEISHTSERTSDREVSARARTSSRDTKSGSSIKEKRLIMPNLFSAAFSIPRLSIQTRSLTESQTSEKEI